MGKAYLIQESIPSQLIQTHTITSLFVNSNAMGKVYLMDSASNTTITVSSDATSFCPTGTQVAFVRNNTGTVTFAPASGVTIKSKDNALSIAGQYGSAVLLKTAANTWTLIGSLE